MLCETVNDEREEIAGGEKDVNTSAISTLFGEDYNTHYNEQIFDRYFSEPHISPDENPLLWWKRNKYHFKHLSILATQL